MMKKIALFASAFLLLGSVLTNAGTWDPRVEFVKDLYRSEKMLDFENGRLDPMLEFGTERLKKLAKDADAATPEGEMGWNDYDIYYQTQDLSDDFKDMKFSVQDGKVRVDLPKVKSWVMFDVRCSSDKCELDDVIDNGGKASDRMLEHINYFKK